AVPHYDVPRDGHEGRRQGIRLRPLDHRAHADPGRRLRQHQRGLRAASTLAGRGRVQVGSHSHRQRLLDRSWRLRALRRYDGRSRGTRCRLVPDEGRGALLAYRLAWQSGEAGAPFSGRGRGRGRIPHRGRVGRRGRVTQAMSERRDRSGTDLVSSAANEPSLKQALDAVAVPGLLIGHRVISLGDEGALRGAEAGSISSSIANVRRASGAARMVARSLLAQLGYPEAQVPMGAGGAPVWPVGVVGSLAHDDEIAVAAVGLRRDLASVGIDVEWAGALPSDMLALVATQSERRRIEDDLVKAKLLFAVKEAVYKAVYPLDRVFLEFGDIEVDLAGGTAMTRAGRTLTLRSCISSHIVALALVHV